MQKFVAHENKTRHLPRLASCWLRPCVRRWQCQSDVIVPAKECVYCIATVRTASKHYTQHDCTAASLSGVPMNGVCAKAAVRPEIVVGSREGGSETPSHQIGGL